MIPLFKVFMPESVIKPLRQTLFSGWIGEGEKVIEFERKLAPWFDNPNVLTTNSGTSAIHLAMRLAGVERGTEVISTPMTCSATNQPILELGAKVVWADINPWTGNIDPEDVRKKITPKTRAVMCVDWGGYPCDFDELNEIARKNGIKLIEDACHAFGALYHSKRVGFHCDFVCTSFQAIKILTTVDGGALICKSKTDYERGRLLRWWGIDRNVKGRDLRCEADITEYGYKFHMNDVAATIGIEQLKYVAGNIRKHQRNATVYNRALHNNLHYKSDRKSSYWLYTIRVKNRDDFIDYMKEHGIATSRVHVRNDKYSIFKDSVADLPGVDEFSKEQISIPVGWWVDADEVVKWLTK